ncbi:hypothetical protein ACFOGI_14690 [Virgibacillus xinjiangensis]|uniref:Uncharacterized protein n=1 Tax=Virgibacillus xinjiangensis TaxID=393090 RepID=A0ABV7CZG4_9BACI
MDISPGACVNRQEDGYIARSARESAGGWIYRRERVEIGRRMDISPGACENQQEDGYIAWSVRKSVGGRIYRPERA